MNDSRLSIFTLRFRELVGTRSITDFSNEYGLKRPTMGQFFSGERVPGAPMLREICEKTGVSADWLLGLSDVKRPDANIKAVCEYTGLSQATVELLHGFNEKHKQYEADGLHLTGESEVLDKLFDEPSFLKGLTRLKVALFEQSGLALQKDSYADFADDETNSRRLRVAGEVIDHAGFVPIPKNNLIDFYVNDAAELIRTAVHNVLGNGHTGTISKQLDELTSFFFTNRISNTGHAMKRSEAQSEELLFDTPEEFEAFRAGIFSRATQGGKTTDGEHQTD